jgi:hypothetical protein
MENILYAIRDFGIGLNCGIWDYSASIISKFGKRKNFVIPGNFRPKPGSNPMLVIYNARVVIIYNTTYE